jgi:hypothetical protein
MIPLESPSADRLAAADIGYGIAAFGVGPLQDAGVSLSRIFGFTAIIAAVMAVLSFFVTRRPALTELAARPGSSHAVSTSRPLASGPGDLRNESSSKG